VVAEYSPDDTVDYSLHSQASIWLKMTLFSEPGVAVLNVPFHFED